MNDSLGEDYQAELDADPYDRMPFGDAQRFEDEQVARDADAERATLEVEAEKPGLDYPVFAIKREEVESGGYLVRNDAELRAFILDDLSYMTDENDRAWWDEISTMSLNDLVDYYFDDSTTLLVPVYTQEVPA